MAKTFRFLPYPNQNTPPIQGTRQQYVRYDSTKNLELYIENKYFTKNTFLYLKFIATIMNYQRIKKTRIQ